MNFKASSYYDNMKVANDSPELDNLFPLLLLDDYLDQP